MSRFRVVSGVVILLALVVVGIGGLTSSAAANPIKPPAPPPVHRTFQITDTYVPGNPAIKPSTSMNTSGPAFTQADVIAYFQKYGFLPLAPGAQLHILTIQFVPASQASQLMNGESVGRPDTYLVCYVSLQGPFLTSSLHANPAAPKRPKTVQYGYEVFDAHTGNSLLWGVYF